MVELLERPLDEAGTPVAVARLLIDPAFPDRDERKLGSDEERVGEDEKQYKKQPGNDLAACKRLYWDHNNQFTQIP